MIILPSIDLKDGRVVRLLRGDFGTVHEVADDPVETARAFVEAGAKFLHSVDLDGALDGVRKNADIIRELCSVPGLEVELGGGIRSMRDLEAVFALGVRRAVIGSSAVSEPDFVKEAVREYGERIAVSVDALGGRVRTRGWVEDSGLDAFSFAGSMEDLGVKTLIFTDIDKDGTLSGPPLEALERMKNSVGCDIIASGGVSDIGDIRSLKELGVHGVIIGKAYYAGTIDLKEAIKEGENAG